MGWWENGRLADAISAYDQAIANAPDFVAAYIGLANARVANEQWELAQATFDQGLIFSPDSAELNGAYAEFLMSRGDSGGARARLDWAAERAVTAQDLIVLAPLYAQVGAADIGEQMLKTAALQAPGSLDTLLVLGDFYVAQGDTDAAWYYYQQLLVRAPGLPVGYMRLSSLANDLGERSQADLYATLVQELTLAGTNP